MSSILSANRLLRQRNSGLSHLRAPSSIVANILPIGLLWRAYEMMHEISLPSFTSASGSSAMARLAAMNVRMVGRAIVSVSPPICTLSGAARIASADRRCVFRISFLSIMSGRGESDTHLWLGIANALPLCYCRNAGLSPPSCVSFPRRLPTLFMPRRRLPTCCRWWRCSVRASCCRRQGQARRTCISSVRRRLISKCSSTKPSTFSSDNRCWSNLRA